MDEGEDAVGAGACGGGDGVAESGGVFGGDPADADAVDFGAVGGEAASTVAACGDAWAGAAAAAAGFFGCSGAGVSGETGRGAGGSGVGVAGVAGVFFLGGTLAVPWEASLTVFGEGSLALLAVGSLTDDSGSRAWTWARWNDGSEGGSGVWSGPWTPATSAPAVLRMRRWMGACGDDGYQEAKVDK